MPSVLFLCTQNSARSQMAEGLTNHYLSGRLEAHSAGIAPATVNPYAIRIMAEWGIDISGQHSKHVDKFAGQDFDYVISLCDGVKQCPIHFGAGQRLHLEFPDPAAGGGTEAERMTTFRQVRDSLRRKLMPLLEKLLSAAGEPPPGS